MSETIKEEMLVPELPTGATRRLHHTQGPPGLSSGSQLRRQNNRGMLSSIGY